MAAEHDFDWPWSNEKVDAATVATVDILKALVLRNRFGRVCARAGWTIEMVFHNGDSLAVRERAWEVVNIFCEAVGKEKLVYWYDGMPAMLTSAMAKNKLSAKKQKSLDNPKGYALIFHMASGTPKPPEVWENNAQDFRLYCRISNDEGIWMKNRYQSPGIGPAMSFIRMAFPIWWILDQPPERNVGSLTTQLVELMQPFWAIAGWGITPAVEERNVGPDGKGQQVLYPNLQRFPGLNALGSHALQSHDFNNAMYSINWLSFVSDALLEKLGGREAVRKQVQASQYLSAGDVGNCLGIRAGDFPGLGDMDKGLTLPSFGEAARLLKPIRAKSRLNNFIGPPPSGSNDEDAWQLACDAYMRRFDEF
ncbi:type VI immunity family protein [Delftia tsuruhatensis]|uniref:type VI immunity family protein n=1 Tax=Delftia tsuruhatensis TaxID=180282 RepID=UPI00289690B5|nr:type VI immunity family protein [Delftia tsuruhatensis]